MSNIYIQEPPALGKVLLKTTSGKIDIELWTKEAPKACANFIQLCMEGYYKGTIFHRVVPEFIVQGGDPNGDGTGGESVYGAPFKDEFHSRLRFNRRGLVAMANAGKDDNGSQFFFTLAATPELQNKHTIFGKVTGDTIYNMIKLAEGEIGPDDRPEHPHRITGTEVLINPFPEIKPRITEEREDQRPKKKKKEAIAVKNLGLLSFGAEAEEDECEAAEFRGKPKSTHDLLEDPMLSKKTAAELELEEEVIEEAVLIKNNTDEAVVSIKEKLKKRDGSPRREASGSKKRKEESSVKENESSEEEVYYLGKERDMERMKERDRVREEIKKLKKEMKGSKQEKKTQEETVERETVSTSKESLGEEDELYTQYVDRYKTLKDKLPAKGQARENFTLSLLAKFKNKLSAIKGKAQIDDVDRVKEPVKVEEDDDIYTDEWMGHTLKFEAKGAVLAKDASTKNDDWFDIYDPRNPINKRKRDQSKKGKTSKK